MTRLTTKLLFFAATFWIQTAVFAAVCFGETDTKSPETGLLDAPEPIPGVSPGDTLWMIVKVIVFLILIIGIFFIIMKVISQQKNKFLSGRTLRSLGGLPLGPNKSIQIVEIGHSLYIVGVAENIQLLEKINDDAEVAYITEMMANGTAFTGPSFESLGGFMKKLRNKPPAEEEMEVAASFQQVFQNKMQHMTDRKKIMEEMLKQENNSDRLNDKS
ncbi:MULTISPECIES: flagellar biosynthetic protein FliO [unclassified Paenibacillus]|uniref:flagellar biosynthetic protein FliO n=1 Tax=unclassified Paenibacillus TaxID=185978 RepID=UPI001B555128|nr:MULTISPECIES: flagellar biosynthetic protein FliO [unclassified Paenibacillus]MBP1155996.1 flagellar protein FliO/FliZ [Paenibacillus sp. PvP091]MBP1168618.1 flagellar protein FliO/FliZ [Paenibacillus sp. PvR098]MBP2439646.1 flagellar protein FliO/FliZ [Paenibacillus sp. PvP052]